MKLKFWGAAKTVTGSMHLMELSDGRKILLDCGIYQGHDGFFQDENKRFPCPPGTIDALILSHAHIDHCGNIPMLVKEGFQGDIFCTHATYDLATIMLLDSARIQEADVEDENRWRKKKGKKLLEALYTQEDVHKALELFRTVAYKKTTRVFHDVEFTFLDAGHMLGSASVNLVIKEGERSIRLGFTGDIGRPERKILLDPQPMFPADFLISESTYGGKDHEPMPEAEDNLLSIITEACVVKKGKLIIPAFSVGRTQDLVHAMDRLANKGKMPRIPVYVDSPMAVDATRVFEMHPECFDKEMLDYMRYDPEPFGFSKLTYVRAVNQSKALNKSKEPCVIISASGMMTAGRVLHHLANSIEDPNNTVLVVGYCAKGTLGEKIVNGAEKIHIHGKELIVRANIVKLSSFSGHAGQTELYNFIHATQKPEMTRQIFLVHGEPDRAELFKTFMTGKGYKDVIVPERGQEFVL